MAKFIISLVAAFAYVFQGVANDSLSVLYAAYKARLTQFVKVDTTAGGSIPAALYWPNHSCADGWLMQHLCPPGINTQKKILYWVDGTVHWGFYMAVLGTEFILLQRQGKSTAELLKPISAGLVALNRLDLAAESKFGFPPAADGFLLRDDVHMLDTAHFKVGCIKSGWVCTEGTNYNMVSLDQLVYSFWGLQFIKKALPSDARNVYTGQNMHHEIDVWTLRVFNRLHSDDWEIFDPTGNRVFAGADARWFGYPLLRMMQQLTPTPLRSGSVQTMGNLAWQVAIRLRFDAQNPLHNEVNLSMLMALWSAGYPRNSGLFEQLAHDSSVNLYVLAAAYLHGWDVHHWQPQFAQIIQTIPLQGPSNQVDGYESVPGWRCESRWFHPYRAQGMPDDQGAVYNGLDAMLLLNLYRLVFTFKQ